MKTSTSSMLINLLGGLHISPRSHTRVSIPRQLGPAPLDNARSFSTTRPAFGSWLEPNIDRSKKMKKGRSRVPTGGSVKGTSVMWGDYGLRIRDHDLRVSAQQLKLAEDSIKSNLRGLKFRLYKRVCCNVGVYTKGNDMRMGKGKGSFDYWAARMAPSQIVFELKGMVHEKLARDAFRIAGNKLPGQWDFVKKGDPPVVGITPLKGVTMEELKRPRRKAKPLRLLEIAPSTVVTESDVQVGVPVTPQA